MNITNPHPNIQIRTSISLNLSASQWNLEVDKFPRTIVEKVADMLNKRVTTEFNKGEPIEKVQMAFNEAAKGFAMYGAESEKTKAVFSNVIKTIAPKGTK